jgi:glycosyltransferase involved in cell wall biosynthesis
MNLLFLTNYYPPAHIGGYEELCAEIRWGLINKGHQISVLTSRRAAGVQPEAGVYRVLHNEIDYQSKFPSLTSFLMAGKKQRENLTRLDEVFSQIQPQGVLVWGMWNLHRQLVAWLERRHDIRVAYYLADYWPTLPSAVSLHWTSTRDYTTKGIIRRLVGKVILTTLPGLSRVPELKFQHVYCVSQALYQRLRADKIIPGNAQVIYNGINLDQFKYQEKNPTARQIRFLYSGRLSPEKGLETLLLAFAILHRAGQPASLSIVGTGEARFREHLQKIACDQGIAAQATFFGSLDRNRMPEMLSEHDVMIVPSVWAEPMPRAIQEAFACGLAVIGSRTGGIPEIVQDEVTGLTFTPGDADSLANCMLRLNEHPHLIPEYARRGRKLVEEKFNILRMTEKLEIELSKLVPS